MIFTPSSISLDDVKIFCFLFNFFAGVLNLTHLRGHSSGDIQPLQPNENYRAQLRLDSTAYTVAAGHKIRLALSSVHWPFVWPSPQASSLFIKTGSQSKLLLPIRVFCDDVRKKDCKLQLQEIESLMEYKHEILPVEWRRKPKRER